MDNILVIVFQISAKIELFLGSGLRRECIFLFEANLALASRSAEMWLEMGVDFLGERGLPRQT